TSVAEKLTNFRNKTRLYKADHLQEQYTTTNHLTMKVFIFVFLVICAMALGMPANDQLRSERGASCEVAGALGCSAHCIFLGHPKGGHCVSQTCVCY
ncbi:hypothetical protein C0J52_20460, partial [Blattella germanica]